VEVYFFWMQSFSDNLSGFSSHILYDNNTVGNGLALLSETSWYSVAHLQAAKLTSE
jgi:hypothetical protein